MLARALEQQGLATVGISLVKEHTEKVRPPRYLFVPFPFGRPLGKPNDPAFQHRVIDSALELLKRKESEKPVLVEFPVFLDAEPAAEEQLACALVLPPRKTAVEKAEKEEKNLLGEVEQEIASLRPFYEESRQKLGRSMVGPSHIKPEELEKAAGYIAAYTSGKTPQPAEKPDGPGLVQYLRWCADDLKVFYTEAALAKQGEQSWSNPQLQDWIWKQTALGELILEFRKKVNAGGDAGEKGVAFGLVPRGY